MNKKQKRQVCVWENTLVGEDKVKEFEEFIKEKFGVKAKYIKEVKSKRGDNDVLFELVGKYPTRFCVERLQYRIRWIEDVLDNGKEYDEDLSIYRTW
jgi:uncharacterized hydantoinase/oxoprolinase family protein